MKHLGPYTQFRCAKARWPMYADYDLDTLTPFGMSGAMPLGASYLGNYTGFRTCA